MIAALLAVAVWQPAGVHPTSAGLPDVLARLHAAQSLPVAYAQRHERWTYRNGTNVLPVRVAVRGAEFRATVAVGAMDYDAGVRDGVRWRADGNGIAHATRGDEQGDPIDRLPNALLPFSDADCSLAGEVQLPAPAWAVVDRPADDREHWFLVDEASGRVVREQTREGKRVVTIDYEDFAPFAGVTRPRRWHVATSGDAADDLDVQVDDVTPGAVSDAELALPEPRLFAGMPGASERPLPASADPPWYQASIAVAVNGDTSRFTLDTGTQSIIMGSGYAAQRGMTTVLGHAVAARLEIGSFVLTNASVLVLPSGPSFHGIIGYDFFAGRVFHVDEPHQRYALLDPPLAAATFADPRETVVPASFDQGLPTAAVRFDGTTASDVALDTGSYGVEVSSAFAQAFPALVRQWTPAIFPAWGRAQRTEEFLEGSVRLDARRIARLQLGPLTVTDLVLGVQGANPAADAIELPFDAIVGNEILSHLDLWFDYDGGRIAMRPER
ncbi:MAG TPA: retropepsin-like aspartic protease [Candidatus Sulfotelmatobacter sp.]|nr:retropepsin-like aspartic protease [Candidatus Sulfotelmatobacter sp.]